MASNPELVKRFRDTVDKVIEINVREIESGPSIPVFLPGYKKEAKAAGLTFTSVDSSDVRLSVFDRERGHLWGVAPKKLRFMGHAGMLAVVSRESEPDSLRRTWHFDGYFGGMLPVVTSRLLDERETELAVSWVAAPHLEPDAVTTLAQLSDEEKERVDQQFAGHAVRREEYLKDVEQMERARRIPPDAWHHVIG